MARKKLTVDIDGVILRGREEEFFDFAHREKGVTDIAEKIAVYKETHNWDTAFGLPKQIVTQWYKEFDESLYCPPPEQVPGALTALRGLQQQGFSLDVVSQRPVEHYSRLRQTFARLFAAVQFDELHLVSGDFKHTAVRQAGAAVHIEDSLHMARNVATEAGVPVIVFPHPYNWHHSRHSQLVYTEAHSLAGEGMQLADWVAVWMAAWREIPHLVADLVAS